MLNVSRFVRSVVLVVGAGLLMSGCAIDPTQEYELSGGDADWVVAPDGDVVVNEDGSEVVSNVSSVEVEGVVVNTLTEFTLNVGGSSSCPPVVDGVGLDGVSGAVDVSLVEYGAGEGCTDDFVMFSYNVAVPSNAGFNLLDRSFNVCVSDECRPFDVVVGFATR